MTYNHILIVDDSSTSRMIVQRCFQIAGNPDSIYSFAEDGLEALDKLENFSDIDLVVTDINMPKMDGINFIKKIKMNDNIKNKTVIVVSSTGDSFVEEELKKAGILGLIRKPISPAKILETIGGGHV